MLVVLFGPPGCGKGTQALTLSRRFRVPVLASGEMLRAQGNLGTTRAQVIRYIINEGYLVPDEMVNHMMFDRIEKPDCADGAILDGYPRTLDQTKSFDAFLYRREKKLDAVIDFKVDMDKMIERRAGRLYAPISQRVYHETLNPPRVPGKCDESGEPLIKRADDEPNVVRHRLEAYVDQSKAMLEYYSKKHQIHQIDGMLEIDDVTKKLLEILEPLEKNKAA